MTWRLLVVLALAAPLVAADEALNLVHNPSFEVTREGTVDGPEGWTYSGGPAPFRRSPDARTGDWSLHLIDPADGRHGVAISRAFDPPPGVALEVWGYHKSYVPALEERIDLVCGPGGVGGTLYGRGVFGSPVGWSETRFTVYSATPLTNCRLVLSATGDVYAAGSGADLAASLAWDDVGVSPVYP